MSHNSKLPVFGSSALILAGIRLLAVPAQGQYETATVLGTITDSAGLPVTAGKVRLESTLTGVSVTGATDGSGNYQFLNVRVGTYKVSAEAPGFKLAIASRGQKRWTTPQAIWRQRMETTRA